MSRKATQSRQPLPVPAPAPAASTPRWVLPVLIAVYSALTLLLIARVPVGAAPDEFAHFEYVEHLATQGTLPVFQPLGAKHPGYEFHQPPLYYVVCAPLWRLTGPGARQYSCRLVSLLCGALTLVLLWHAVAALFPDKPHLPLSATGFAALWPLHQGVGASASNDALAGLLCAANFAVIARASTRAWQVHDAILLGVLTGLGLLTKTTCLVMGVVALGAAWSLARKSASNVPTDKGQSTLPAILQPGIVAGVALLIGGWWLARNQIRYGDPLALGVFNLAFSHSSRGPAWFFQHGITLLIYFEMIALFLFCTAWGVFGGPNNAQAILSPLLVNGLPSSNIALSAVLGLMAICAAASLVVLWGLARGAAKWRSQSTRTRAALWWWMFGLILVALAWAQFNTRYFQAQARYFHPALLPLALAFALGWQQALGGVWRGRLLVICSILFGSTLLALSLANAFGWRTLA